MTERTNPENVQSDILTLPLPPTIRLILDNNNMSMNLEESNLYISNIVDFAIKIIVSENNEFTIIDVVELARMFKHDVLSDENVFKDYCRLLESAITELAAHIIIKDIENYDLTIINCLNDNILIKKGIKWR